MALCKKLNACGRAIKLLKRCKTPKQAYDKMPVGYLEWLSYSIPWELGYQFRTRGLKARLCDKSDIKYSDLRYSVLNACNYYKV